MRELIPRVDAKFRTVANRDGRAIQGMSMGGEGGMRFAVKHPDLFSSFVACAGHPVFAVRHFQVPTPQVT